MANMANIIPPINLKQLTLFPFCSDVDMRSRIVLTNPKKSAVNIFESGGLVVLSTTLLISRSNHSLRYFVRNG